MDLFIMPNKWEYRRIKKGESRKPKRGGKKTT